MTRTTERRLQFEPPFVYTSPATSVVGKPFNVSMKTVQSLHTEPKSYTTLTAANTEQIVVVTGASSTHFDESKGLIESFRKYMPDRPIIYYDLGLTKSQASEVKRTPSVISEY